MIPLHQTSTLVSVIIENQADLYLAERGIISFGEVRAVHVNNARVSMGTTHLCLSKRLIDELGLDALYSRTALTRAGISNVSIYRAVRLTVMDREFLGDVVELTDDSPVVIGRIILHALDLVIDPVSHCVIGNPEHGGEKIIDL